MGENRWKRFLHHGDATEELKCRVPLAREKLIINPWIKNQKRGFFGFPLFLNDRHFSHTHTHTHGWAQRNENGPRRSTSDVVGWVANGRVADVLVSVAGRAEAEHKRKRTLVHLYSFGFLAFKRWRQSKNGEKSYSFPSLKHDWSN